jgi:hypothetical protein
MIDFQGCIVFEMLRERENRFKCQILQNFATTLQARQVMKYVCGSDMPE